MASAALKPVDDAVNARDQRFTNNGVTMEVSGWDQLVRLWELIVLVCKFLWNLLRLLGGG
ncbi:MAG TPA: hypothetical protein VGN31_07295 [Paraburkholderia sp.]|jgi:hypothetical protein